MAADRQVVVGVVELGAARGGQPVPLGGPAAAVCCHAAAALDWASPASISASRCLRTPAAEMPSRSPISPAVMGPDSSSSWTIALRV